MKNNFYPQITAQILHNKNDEEKFYLFNTSTNMGYSIDGLAAQLCRKFNGDKTLTNILAEFEIELGLEKDEYKDEINTLLEDLEKNKLIAFHEKSQAL